MTDFSSFESLSYWMGMIHDNADANCEIILLANKSDMKNNIAKELADGKKVDKFCNENNLEYYKVSAKEDQIDSAIMELVTRIIQNEHL